MVLIPLLASTLLYTRHGLSAVVTVSERTLQSYTGRGKYGSRLQKDATVRGPRVLQDKRFPLLLLVNLRTVLGDEWTGKSERTERLLSIPPPCFM